MKRFVIAGLILCLVTLFSCSRKKKETTQQASIRAETPGGDDFEWNEEELDIQKLIDKSHFNSLIPDEKLNKNDERTSSLEQTFDDFTAEEERLGSEVLSYLEDESNFTSPIIEETPEPSDNLENNEETTVPKVESVEKRLLDANNKLKAMEFESEVFVPYSKEDSSVLVHYSNKNAVRLFYDNLYRLTKKEYWKMDSVENSKITGTEFYSYEGESKKPYEKKIQTDSAVFVSKLNENGLVIRIEKIVDKKTCSVTTITYDNKDRIITQSVTEDGIVKKEVFNYSVSDKAEEKGEEEVPPDYEYYENNNLVTKTEYSKKGVYSTTIWFDKTNSVRTDYENYVKVREVYYTNGVERRVKNYE